MQGRLGPPTPAHTAPSCCFSEQQLPGPLPAASLPALDPAGGEGDVRGSRGPGGARRPRALHLLLGAPLPDEEAPLHWLPAALRAPGAPHLQAPAPAGPCNLRRSWRHLKPPPSPLYQRRGPYSPAPHPALPRPTLPPAPPPPRPGSGHSRPPPSTGGCSPGAKFRAMGGSHSQTPRGREPAGERHPRPTETA